MKTASTNRNLFWNILASSNNQISNCVTESGDVGNVKGWINKHSAKCLDLTMGYQKMTDFTVS